MQRVPRPSSRPEQSRLQEHKRALNEKAPAAADASLCEARRPRAHFFSDASNSLRLSSVLFRFANDALAAGRSLNTCLH